MTHWKKYPLGMISSSLLLIVYLFSLHLDETNYGNLFDLLLKIGMVITFAGTAFDVKRRTSSKSWSTPLLFLIYLIGQLLLFYAFPHSDLYNSYFVTSFVFFWFLLLLELGKEKDNGLTTGLYLFLKSFLPSLGFFGIVALVEIGVFNLIEYFVLLDFRIYLYALSISGFILFQYFLIHLDEEEDSKFLNSFHQWILMPASVLMVFVLLIGSIMTILNQQSIQESILLNYYFFILTGWTAYFLSVYRLEREENLWLDHFQKAFPVINGVLSMFLLALFFMSPRKNFYTPALLYFLYSILLNFIFGIFSFTKKFHKYWVRAFLVFIIWTLLPIGPYPVAIYQAKKEVEKTLEKHPEYLENGKIKKDLLKSDENISFNTHFKNYILWTDKDFYGFPSKEVFEILDTGNDSSPGLYYDFYNKPAMVEDRQVIYFPFSYYSTQEEYYIQIQKHSFSVMKGKEVLDNFSLENIHEESKKDSIVLIGEHGNFFVLTSYEEHQQDPQTKKEILVEGVFIAK